MNNNQYNQNYSQYQQPNNGGSFIDKIKAFLLNTPVEKEPIAIQDIESNKMVSLIAYIGILFWIPLVATKNSRFARFHANQGLVFCLFSVVLSFASTIAYTVFELIPVLGDILAVILSLAIYVADFGLMILGIYNCVKGRPNELPIIGKLRIIKTTPDNNFNNANNYYNPNNNYNANNYNANSYNATNNAQSTGFDANSYSSGTPQIGTGFDANSYSSSTPQTGTGFDANSYSSGTPQQSTGFDANSYSSGTPQQSTGFDANSYSSGTDSFNNTNL